MNTRVWQWLGATAIGVLLASTEPEGNPAAAQPVNPEAAALADFAGKVRAYVDLHLRLEKELPELKRNATGEEIVAHQKELGLRIRSARAKARQGDVFDSHVRILVRGIIARELQKPGGTAARNTLREDDPGPFVLRVNMVYPSDLPISTVPPSLLAALPVTPDEVEYRFVGRHLILRDTHADIVVDYLLNALR